MTRSDEYPHFIGLASDCRKRTWFRFRRSYVICSLCATDCQGREKEVWEVAGPLGEGPGLLFLRFSLWAQGVALVWLYIPPSGDGEVGNLGYVPYFRCISVTDSGERIVFVDI